MKGKLNKALFLRFFFSVVEVKSGTQESMGSCHKVLLLKPRDCLVFDSGYSPLHGIPLLFRYSGPGFCLFLPRRSYKHRSNPEVLTLQGAFQTC